MDQADFTGESIPETGSHIPIFPFVTTLQMSLRGDTWKKASGEFRKVQIDSIAA